MIITNSNLQSFGRNTLKNGLYTGGRLPVPIYVIDKNGECKKYRSISDYAKELHIRNQTISSALRGGYRLHGNIIKKAFELENENGFLDNQKVILAIKNQPKLGRKAIPVYCINENGSAKKFESIKDMAKFLNIYATKISAAINNSKRYKGFIFEQASEIEDKDGTVSNSKLQTIIEKYKKTKRKKIDKPMSFMYAINTKNGKYIKFESPQKLAEVFGIHPKTIDYLLQNPKLTLRNYKLAKANQIENESGEVDVEKIKRFTIMA